MDATSDRRPYTAPISVIATPTASGNWIALVGELDLANADQLEAALADINLAGELPVHLDLSMLSFCDGRGLGLLLDFQEHLQAEGRRVSMHGARPSVQKLAELLSNGRADFDEPLPLV